MIFSKRTTIVLVVFLQCLLQCCSRGTVAYEGRSPKVFLDKSNGAYTLIRDGKSFEIKGASGAAYFKELKEAGANTVRVYDTVGLGNTLDSADAVGLAVIVDIPFPRFSRPDTIFTNNSRMAELLKSTKKFVNTHKNHPALLYWILGNEISYPNLPGDKNLTGHFNAFIDMIHEEDPNHPVSTAVSGFNRSGILSIQTLSGSIDLISINLFGEVSSFSWRKKLFSLLWNGPYVFSEFSINGPWEAKETRWEAPIEQTSTKKASLFRNRYDSHIATIDDGRFLGSLFFYWGHKQERTHTWFSTVMPNGYKTELAFEFENIWKQRKHEFDGPEIEYALLNGRGAQESIVLAPGERSSASLLLSKEDFSESYATEWQIRPENWNYFFNEIEETPDPIPGLIRTETDTTLVFEAPRKEGPYRLFIQVWNQNGHLATTNIPFYILDPENVQ